MLLPILVANTTFSSKNKILKTKKRCSIIRNFRHILELNLSLHTMGEIKQQTKNTNNTILLTIYTKESFKYDISFNTRKAEMINNQI
ncbi:hypothetical protein AKG94_19280 [Vibrio harveyi]|nr:hypothetical protein AKG94_19280 [Vibrio harveyi]